MPLDEFSHGVRLYNFSARHAVFRPKRTTHALRAKTWRGVRLAKTQRFTHHRLLALCDHLRRHAPLFLRFALTQFRRLNIVVLAAFDQHLFRFT
jgi:hypothetical protein